MSSTPTLSSSRTLSASSTPIPNSPNRSPSPSSARQGSAPPRNEDQDHHEADESFGGSNSKRHLPLPPGPRTSGLGSSWSGNASIVRSALASSTSDGKPGSHSPSVSGKPSFKADASLKTTFDREEDEELYMLWA